MKHTVIFLALASLSASLFASENSKLQQEIIRLQHQTKTMQAKLNHLQKQMAKKPVRQPVLNTKKKPSLVKEKDLKAEEAPKDNALSHESALYVLRPDKYVDPSVFYPTALIADDRVITYIAGTPVVTSPYTGDRPAFDGSDYIVNISSINRDIRLLEQRRRLYQIYKDIGYPAPKLPILALSGKLEPVAIAAKPYVGDTSEDLTLGSSELDVTAVLNSYVEGFMSMAFDASPPVLNRQRVANSSFDLNLGFINIGNLETTPFYFTAGQLYAPYGRYASAMISSPITLGLARTKTRPFILGYKSQQASGPYAAVYAFTSDTTLGDPTVPGFNFGYNIATAKISGDIGAGIIGNLADSQGMQNNGSPLLTTFGGFSSVADGSEAVKKIPGLDVHANFSIDRYSFTAEWVGASEPFRVQDLSFDGKSAQPQAAQLEAGVTFKVFDKPASVAVGYQWSEEALALNLPEQRISAVFNISIWKDTVESIEYRHDIDYSASSYANGAAPAGRSNLNTLGTGRSSDAVIAQIGVYF